MSIFKFFLSKKFLIVFVILVLIGVGAFFFFKSKSESSVSTATVEFGTVKEELILTGAVRAEKHAILSFASGGKIANVSVVEGQEVKKGQSLVSLDRTVLNASYQQALNNYRNYQAAAELALDNVKNHSSDETYTQKASRTAAEVDRDNAFDAVTSARYALSNATIYAPFPGIVSSLAFPSVGVDVAVTDTIVEVVDPTSIYFEVDADQSEITNITVGQEVAIVLDAVGDKSISGKVVYVGLTPKAGEVGTIYKVKVSFTEGSLDTSIKVGMTGDARFTLSQVDNVLFAPFEFVNSDKDGKFVNLGRPNNKVRVETGLEGEEMVEIKTGVNRGDTLYD